MTVTIERLIATRDRAGLRRRSTEPSDVVATDAGASEASAFGHAADDSWQIANGEHCALRCAWCHDDLDEAAAVFTPELEAEACEACGVWLHRACREESRADGGPACPTLGCPGRRLYAPLAVANRAHSGPRRLIRHVSGPGRLLRYGLALPLSLLTALAVMLGGLLCSVIVVPIPMILLMICGLTAESALLGVGGVAAVGIGALGWTSGRQVWREMTRTEVRLTFEG